MKFSDQQLRKHCYKIYRIALRRGVIVRKPCKVCDRKAEGHHDDYFRPLKVEWLCRKHHRIEHQRRGDIGKTRAHRDKISRNTKSAMIKVPYKTLAYWKGKKLSAKTRARMSKAHKKWWVRRKA